MLTALVVVARVRLIDHPPLLHEVGEPVRHPGVGGQPVAAGAAGLLVVALDRFGQVEMRDEAHVGLVDAHAERDGRHHDDAVLALEAGLVRGSRLRVHAGVVGERGDAVADEPRRPSRPPSGATGSRRCPPRPDARRARSAAAARAARPCRRSCSGCSAGRSSRRRRARRRGRAATTISARVCGSAVAVSAMRGTPGKRSCSTESCRYSGRKSWPHCETQCASSMAKSASRARPRRSRQPRRQRAARAPRTGDRARPRRAPARPSCASAALSAELRNAARTPAWRSAST